MNHENDLGVCNYAFLCKWIDRKGQVRAVDCNTDDQS